MRILSLLALFLALTACHHCVEYNDKGEKVHYELMAPEDGYVPAKGRVFHVMGFDIEEGQQIRDFFDDFEEPMHAKYKGGNVINWVYYVDYNAKKNKGKIVRYCELDKYDPKSLCRLDVTFFRTYVTDAKGYCR